MDTAVTIATSLAVNEQRLSLSDDTQVFEVAMIKSAESARVGNAS